MAPLELIFTMLGIKVFEEDVDKLHDCNEVSWDSKYDNKRNIGGEARSTMEWTGGILYGCDYGQLVLFYKLWRILFHVINYGLWRAIFYF